MVKHKIPADVRSLADRYFCEQCDRLGLPRPHAIKPIKAPRWVTPRSHAEMRAAIAPGEPAPEIGLEAIWEAFDGSDGSQR